MKWVAVARLLPYVCVCFPDGECLGFLGVMIKMEVGTIRSAVGNECGEITHGAGPAVSLMTSWSCGFHENQTFSHSCFHTKPSCFGDPNAFVSSFFVILQREIVWLFWHG